MPRDKAAGPRLVSYVHVVDDKGVSQAFGPDDDVPAWARRRIDNPKAWEGGELPKVSGPKPVAGKRTTDQAGADDPAPVDPDADADVEGTPDGGEADEIVEETAGDGSPDDDGDPAPDDDEAAPPPKNGAGSAKAAWAAYAQSNHVDVPDDATRDEIVEALAEAGVDTE